MIVDDEILIRWSLSEILEKAGYRTRTAASVAEAREQLKESPFDLVITDLKMPEEDGFSLIGEVKTRLPSCSFIMISAFGEEELKERARALGVSSFFDKPLDLNSVLWMSNRLLQH